MSLKIHRIPLGMAWAYLIETEKKACTVPGLVDTGQHIILAAVKD